MARDKKKSLGIKTSRYYTKTCVKCKFEYPNWFTNCPKCGSAWDEPQDEDLSNASVKTIKIVVKITQDDFDEKLEHVNLIFSADNGKSWYQMQMEDMKDYFIIELADVPNGSVIIYYIEVFLKNGEKVIENNEGKFYYYTVGSYNKENVNSKRDLPELKKDSIDEPFYQNAKPIKDQYFNPQVPEKISSQKNSDNAKNPHDITIFSKPITEIDPELKLCSNCSSKIKKMWSICPICGKPT
jgi:RNA polymerase subunit RPABC4/transcription elongation factor Spt4